jgi:hypothetical protein
MELYNKKEQEKVAMVLALSIDETKWNKELISEFLSQYPMLQQTPMNITWKKKNANKGYGVGSITILGGAVPVIVNNFQAAPFDVIAFPGRVLPLDKYTIQEMMSTNNPFVGAASGAPKGSLSIFGDKEIQTTPNDQSSGNTSYERPAMKVASFIDRISSFDYKDVRALAESISEELGTNSLDNSAEVTKIAAKATDYDRKWSDLLSSLNFDRQYIFEDREGNSYVKQAFSGLDYTVVTPINAEEQEQLNNKYAELEKVAEKEDKIEFVAFDEIKKGQEGQFVDKNGNTTPKITIVDIEKVAELTDYVILPVKDSNKSLVLDEESHFIFVDRKVPSARNIDMLWKFVETKPAVGDKGVWVINGQASEMFQIEKIIPDLSSPGSFEIKASKDGFEVEYYLIPTEMDGLKLKEGHLNEYWVPGNATFVRLGGRMYGPNEAITKIVENSVAEGSYFKISALQNWQPVEYIIQDSEQIENNVIPSSAFFGIEKEAQQTIEDAPHIVYRDFGGFYHLFGPEFEKYANNDHEINNLNKQEIVWPLIHLGASEDKVEEVLKMYPGDEVKIANRLKAPFTVVEFEKAAQAEYLKEAVQSHTIPVLENAVKLAANYNDAATVDAVLSLGLVNKFNVKEYLNLIPDYERVLSELARLLIYSRMTNLNFRSDVLEETVRSFNEVLYGLKGLREVMSYDKAALPSNI